MSEKRKERMWKDGREKKERRRDEEEEEKGVREEEAIKRRDKKQNEIREMKCQKIKENRNTK